MTWTKYGVVRIDQGASKELIESKLKEARKAQGPRERYIRHNERVGMEDMVAYLSRVAQGVIEEEIDMARLSGYENGTRLTAMVHLCELLGLDVGDHKRSITSGESYS